MSNILLKLENVSVFVDEKPVVKEISFAMHSGTMHVCMGPNGSGKSSLAYALAGHPHYKATGSASLMGQELFGLSPDKRAQAGLFLSMQYPQAVPGVSVRTLLKESFHALYPDETTTVFEKRLQEALALLHFEELALHRGVHDGFSGGEKKRCEMLQLLVLQPKVAILDEIDSGLDVDALKAVGNALRYFKTICPESSLFLITHYHHILSFINPDVVHVMKEGRLVASGDASLVLAIQEKGYEQL